MMPLLKIVAEIKKILRITKNNLWSLLATRGKRVHLHTLVDRERKRSSERGLMESYSSLSKSPMTERRTDGTSAFNTRTVGEDVSSFLIQQGEGEVDGDPAARRRGGGSSGDLGRASPSSARGRGVTRGEGGTRDLGCSCPPSPPLYIGPLGGRRP